MRLRIIRVVLKQNIPKNYNFLPLYKLTYVPILKDTVKEMYME